MAGRYDSETRVTLLGRLRRDPTNQAAWREFVDHYGRKVYGWCRAWGLQDADAKDVTQDVLVKLAAKMRDFAYDPARSFRATRSSFWAWGATLAKSTSSNVSRSDESSPAALALVLWQPTQYLSTSARSSAAVCPG